MGTVRFWGWGFAGDALYFGRSGVVENRVRVRVRLRLRLNLGILGDIRTECFLASSARTALTVPGLF